MTNVEKLKKTFAEIGIRFKEHKDEDGYTYISPCSESVVNEPLNVFVEDFFEFDEDGNIASY